MEKFALSLDIRLNSLMVEPYDSLRGPLDGSGWWSWRTGEPTISLGRS
jgi:hypothetical protein